MKGTTKKIYYLNATNIGKKICESLCICENEDSIENPLSQTGVYPIGTFLSKTIRIIKPWIENSNDPSGKEEELVKAFAKFNSDDFSFSSIMNSDINAKRILSLLLLDKENPNTNRDNREIFRILLKYMDFIYQCQNNPNLCQTKLLNVFIRQQNIIPPNHLSYIPANLNNEILNLSDILDTVIGSPFLPKYRDHSVKKMVSIQSSYPSTVKTAWEPLVFPVEVYEVCDEIDLFSASLNCLFKYHYIVKKCKYCNNLFFTHRANQNYCPFLFSDNRSKSCQRRQNTKLQLEREESGRRKMERSLSSIYLNKYGTESQEYRDLLDFFKTWRNYIKSGQKTEEEYVEKLKTKYIKKYKNKNTRTVS